MATSSDSDSNQIQPRRRAVKYEFVWLDERRKSTPRGKDWDQLNRNGRVKEIEINLQLKARHMGDLVRTNFPELRNADLTRIRIYKSYSRGSRMERVFSGIPDAKSIKETFNKPSSRRVYLYLKPDTPALSQPSTSASNVDSGSGSDICAPVVAIQPNRTPPRGQPNSNFSVTAHLASPATHPTPISPTSVGSNGAPPTTGTQQDPTHQITDPGIQHQVVHVESDYDGKPTTVGHNQFTLLKSG